MEYALLQWFDHYGPCTHDHIPPRRAAYAEDLIRKGDLVRQGPEVRITEQGRQRLNAGALDTLLWDWLTNHEEYYWSAALADTPGHLSQFNYDQWIQDALAAVHQDLAEYGQDSEYWGKLPTGKDRQRLLPRIIAVADRLEKELASEARLGTL